MVYNWLKNIQQRLPPPVCRLCLAPGLPGLELCTACRDELPWLRHACRTCAAPLPERNTASLCAACQKRRPPVDACRALFLYRSPVDRWILDLKFRQDLASARLLGQLLLENTPPPRSNNPAVLIPVPLHRRRLAQRGYNQSREIARRLQRGGFRSDTGLCRRQRATEAQSDLPADRRRSNIRGAFAVTGVAEGRRFILIDDVMTTGATLNELARTLKRAGAARVEARVIARTPVSGKDLRSPD